LSMLSSPDPPVPSVARGPGLPRRSRAPPACGGEVRWTAGKPFLCLIFRNVVGSCDDRRWYPHPITRGGGVATLVIGHE
jgi:hypothetical protein